MRFLLFLTIFVSVVYAQNGTDAGRKGNTHYTEKKYAEAAQYYRQGISVMKSAPSKDLSALYNNLGSSLYRQKQFVQADEAFDRAMLASTEKGDFSRAAYNRGNAAMGAQKTEEALEAYRQAMLADPNNANARYNYEIARRQLQKKGGSKQNKDQQKQQQNQSQQNKDQQNQDQNQQNQDQNQQNKDQQQQNRDQQNKDQQQQNRDQQNKDQQQQNRDQQKPEQLRPTKPDKKVNQEQARQILEAMKNDEQRLLQQLRRRPAQPSTIEKDW